MAILGRTTNGFPIGQHILTCENNADRSPEFVSDELPVSSNDSVFGFVEGSTENTGNSDGYYKNVVFGEDEDEEKGKSNDHYLHKNKKFWDNQHHLLEATLCRTTALETRIRNQTKDALKEIQAQGDYCKCQQPVAGDGGVSGCRSCLMREVSTRLRNAGYNCAVCRSKWKSSPEIPAGEHTYLDVIDNSSLKKGDIRVIIELNFRAEFQIARASEHYNQLISRLPEVFIGKDERLQALIKIVCSAAKKCLKDKKMHMGPWRKQTYVISKWFSHCERMEVTPSARPINSNTKIRPVKASLLTRVLVDMPRNMVAVM